MISDGLYDPADLPTLLRAMQTDGGKQWKRGKGKHPPGIELYVAKRYFAITGEHVASTPPELRTVATDTLLHLITTDGPDFARSGGANTNKNGPSDFASPADSSNDQSRSAKAFRLALKARRLNPHLTFEQMKEALLADPETGAWTKEKGQPSGQRELHKIWEKTDPATFDLVLSPGKPLHSARQYLLREHTAAAMRTLHHQNGTFFAWRSSHYVERHAEEMRSALYRFLDGAKRINDEDQLVDFDPTKNKVANVVEAVAAEAQLTQAVRAPAWLVDDASAPNASEIIACANVLLHLPTGRTRDHTSAFFTLNALDFDYHPTASDPVEWLKFLATVWPDDQQTIDTLQELFGLCLTAETKYQKAFLIVGPKRSGKGTIARVLTQFLGAANVCGPTLSGLGTNFGIAPLIGKRLAIVSDARLSGKVDQQVIVERLLSITGEDGLTIDRKFRDCWTGKLDARFLILTNEMPRLTDSSGALASRFIILKMVQSFIGREDLGLGSKLTPELPGILLWAIAGWKRLTERGYFIPPASSAAAQQEMEDLGSPIGAFLRDRCMIGQGLGVRVDEMYRAWCEWCQQQGRDHPGHVATFGRDLAAAVPGLRISQPRRGDGSRFRYYEGVTFAPNPT